MKKILFYVLMLALGGVVAGCNSDNEPVVDLTSQSGPISFTLNAPQLKTRAANTDFIISSIDLLICDGEERVLQKASTTSDGAGKYTAQVVYSNEPRIVHFIANYDWAGWDDATHLGKDAGEVLAGISTDKFTAWKRIELANGITQQTPFGTTPIELICNMAKFTLSVESGLTDVSFAIYNYDRGTIATFNPRATGDGHAFEEDIITIPAGVQMKVPTPADFQPMTDGAVFAFERDNASAGANYSCMIIKGKYEGADTYYKIDIVDTEEIRQDIVRNHSYHITINGVSNIGHPDIASAINSAADNTNFSLDPSLEIYPSITDGMRKLEVDRNFIAITNASQSANFTATYSVRSGSTWNTENNRMSVEVKPIAGYGAAVSNASINTTTGEVSVTTNAIPASGELRSKVEVKVDYMDGSTSVKLYRSVTVVVRPAFTLEAAQVGTVPAIQKSVMNAKIKLPQAFPTELLPLEIRFKTNNFYPHDDNKMRFTVEDGVPVYIYTAYEKGVDIDLKFLSNRANSAETIIVTADYFNQVNMAISN